MARGRQPCPHSSALLLMKPPVHTTFISHSSGGWEVSRWRYQHIWCLLTARFLVTEGRLLVASSHDRRGQGLWGGSFTRSLVLLMRAPSL